MEVIITYWAFIVLVCTEIWVCCYDMEVSNPSASMGYFDPEGNFGPSIETFSRWFLHPTVIIANVLAILGVWMTASTNVSSWQKQKAIWHLTNFCFWSSFCDAFTGLFEMTPMVRFYHLMDVSHVRGVAARAHLDTCYWAELTIHVPLSLICFYGTLNRKSWTPALESALAGIQFMGTIGYYGPEILKGMEVYTNLFSWAGIAFGALWIIYPAILVLVQMSEASSKQKTL